MISIKTTINRFTFLTLVLCVQSVFGQTSNFKEAFHKDLLRFGAIHPKGDEWEKERKVLATHSQEELARTMIAEVGLDHDLSGMNNNSVRQLYHALDLPPAFICQELGKTNSAGRKAALIDLLEGYKQPEVTAMLLQQIKDHKVAYTIADSPDLEGPGRSMRVCDVACNVLSYNLRTDGSNSRVFVTNPENRKDEIIQETLKNLRLSVPQ